jgi:hypothetical protein
MRHKGLFFGGAPRISLLGQGSTRVRRAVALACALALAVHAAWLGFASYASAQALGAANAKMRAAQAAVERLHRPQARADMANPHSAAGSVLSASTISVARRDALNGVVLRLNVPWHDIFEQLEQSTPAGVALLGVEPDGPRQQIRLQAEAATLDALLRYASSLQYQGVFGRLSYTKHETNAQDPSRPVRLSFELGLLAPARLTDAAFARSVEGGAQ